MVPKDMKLERSQLEALFRKVSILIFFHREAMCYKNNRIKTWKLSSWHFFVVGIVRFECAIKVPNWNCVYKVTFRVLYIIYLIFLMNTNDPTCRYDGFLSHLSSSGGIYPVSLWSIPCLNYTLKDLCSVSDNSDWLELLMKDIIV